MLNKFLLGILAVVVGFAIVVATRPAAFKIERSLAVHAPPAVVAAQINDFHNWAPWSPWAKLDPTMKTTYEGPASGVGASYSWSGNSKVGQGKMTIKESTPAATTIDLQFEAPMKAENTTVFAFQPTADGTNVVWTMTGENNFMGKAFAMVMDMDKMVGGDFERGLGGLKTVAEAEAQKKAAAAPPPTPVATAAAPTPAPTPAAAPAPAPQKK